MFLWQRTKSQAVPVCSALQSILIVRGEKSVKAVRDSLALPIITITKVARWVQATTVFLAAPLIMTIEAIRLVLHNKAYSPLITMTQKDTEQAKAILVGFAPLKRNSIKRSEDCYSIRSHFNYSYTF